MTRRFRFPIIVLAAILPFVAQLVRAADAPDISSPKAAARSMYSALERGDEAALREIFFAGDDAQRDLASEYAHLVVEGKRLADVAKQKYPGASDAMTQSVIAAEDLAKIDTAVVTEKGDTATLQLAPRTREMQFRRAGGGWHLVITNFGGGELTDENLVEQTAIVREFAKAISDTADEIAADKHATPQEAETALQTRVNLVLTKAVKSVPPTSVPTTAPTTRPHN